MLQGICSLRCVAKALAAGWVLSAALVAQASEFSVGRVEIQFAESGWKEIVLPDTIQTYGGDKRGELGVQTKLYVLGTPSDAAHVLVLVSGVSAGLDGAQVTMRYSPNCKSDARNYREGNNGSQMPFAQCLTVLPRYNSESVFTALAPQVLELQKAGKISSMGSIYTVSSFHAISTGTHLHVQVFMTSSIVAPELRIEETLPTDVRPELVAWGRQLKDAVKSSVHSISGRLVFPPIRLVPHTPPVPSTGTSRS